jgi:hypothetical protein
MKKYVIKENCMFNKVYMELKNVTSNGESVLTSNPNTLDLLFYLYKM